MENLIKVNSESGLVLDSISESLIDLASCFAATGNEPLAIRLRHYGKIIHETRQAIDKAVGETIHDYCMKAQESSNNMYRAALAGIALAQPKKSSIVKKISKAL